MYSCFYESKKLDVEGKQEKIVKKTVDGENLFWKLLLLDSWLTSKSCSWF